MITPLAVNLEARIPPSDQVLAYHIGGHQRNTRGKPERTTLQTGLDEHPIKLHNMNETSEMKGSVENGNTTHLIWEKMSTGEFSVVTALYIVLVFAILVGNGLVLVVFTLNKRLRSLANLLVRSLAVSDLLVGLVTCPCWVYIFVCQYFLVEYSENFYQFYITADIFIGSASILQLTSFSIERCHAIVCPLKHRLLSKKVFVAMIVTPWLFAGFVASLQPLQFERWKKLYTIIMTASCFFVPLVIICVAYFCIFKFARSRENLSPNRSSTDHQKELTLAITVATITGLFVISWLPLFVVTVIATYKTSHLPSPLGTDRLLKFVKFCHYGNSALNPVVYTFRNKEMRSTFRHLLLKLICRGQDGTSSDTIKSWSLRSKATSFRNASKRSEETCKGATAHNSKELESTYTVAVMESSV